MTNSFRIVVIVLLHLDMLNQETGTVLEVEPKAQGPEALEGRMDENEEEEGR